jgi:hypothetical protein
MKLKLKIIKESQDRPQSLIGFYDLLDIHPGSLDIFWSHFVDPSWPVQEARYNFIDKVYGEDIREKTLTGAPPKGERREKALKSTRGLLWGNTYYWNKFYGKEAAKMMIEFKVLSYLSELKSKLNEINYKSITAEEFENLPEEKKAVVYEKHFLEDHLENFLDQEFSTQMQGTTGYLGNPGVGTGMAGMAKDWWMTTTGQGLETFKQLMKELITKLPQRNNAQ